MRPQVVSQTGVGTTAAIPVDQRSQNFQIGFGAVINGTVTYTIEHTFDDVLGSTGPYTWFPHASVAGATTNRDGNYAYPIRAVRINVTAGTGTVTATFLQTSGQG